MTSNLKKSLVLNFAILFLANVYEVFKNTPPDDRWKIQIPVTTIFILIYFILFVLINKKMKNEKNYNFMLLFNIVLSIIFVSFSFTVQRPFMDVNSPLNTASFYVMNYIPIMNYVIIFGLGLLAYVPLLWLIQRKTK